MKKIFFFAAAALMSTAMYADLKVATFEDVTLPGEESVLHLDTTGYFQSGGYGFIQEVQDYADYGKYYFVNIVSNKTGNTYDYYADSDKSASGGAYEGNNFNVWTSSYSYLDYIMVPGRSVVPGMYINNTAWVVDAIVNGDGMSVDPNDSTLIGTPFGEDDILGLLILGVQIDQANDTSYVVGQKGVYLAKGTQYIHEWTYVELASLGKVDVIMFQLMSTKTNNSGMTTPAYFCIDNFGAAAPEGVENTNVEVKAVKEIRNGQIVIRREGKTFNILGTEL